MKYVDLCVAGADESREILGAKGNSDEALAADLVERFGFKTVAMTSRRGGTASATNCGALLFTGGRAFHSPRHEIVIVPAHACRCVSREARTHHGTVLSFDQPGEAHTRK